MDKRNMSLKEKLDKRRLDAETRSLARASRTDQDQLEKLIARGHGHCKEALMLKAKVENKKDE